MILDDDGLSKRMERKMDLDVTVVPLPPPKKGAHFNPRMSK